MSLNDKPSNQFNESPNCGVHATGGQLLLSESAVSSSLSQLWLHAHAFEHPKCKWSCLGLGCSQQCWTVESASAEGQWSLFPDVPCTSCICWTTLQPCLCKDEQYPWVGSLCAGVGSLCAGALPSQHHSPSGSARSIVHSRDQRLLSNHPESSRPLRASSPPPATWTISAGSTQLAARPVMIKTLR